MNVIVPLAGPDFIHPSYGIRPLFPVEGEPLITTALASRPWMRQGGVANEDLIFVYRDLPEAAEVRAVLEARYPGCSHVALGRLTGGALFSAMAGAALVGNDRPVCIDLVDILYDWPDWQDWASWPAGRGAMLPTFTSSDPAYSYIVRDAAGAVTATAEKRVVSDEASAGTYFFRDLPTFLGAAAHSLVHREDLAFKGNLFVCPAMNGVLASGLAVAAPAVGNVRPVGKLFH